MNLITREFLQQHQACYEQEEIESLVPETGLTAQELLEIDEERVPTTDKFWVLSREGVIPYQKQRELIYEWTYRAVKLASKYNVPSNSIVNETLAILKTYDISNNKTWGRIKELRTHLAEQTSPFEPRDIRYQVSKMLLHALEHTSTNALHYTANCIMRIQSIILNKTYDETFRELLDDMVQKIN